MFVFCRVVPYEEYHKNNFLTMSTHGVTQYYDDQMYFTPLAIWKHEYDLYRKVLQIKTFRQFRQWKAFYKWKKGLTYDKFVNAQTLLESNLVILIPMLRDAALAIQAMCVKLESANLTNKQLVEDFLLYYFLNDQVSMFSSHSRKHRP